MLLFQQGEEATVVILSLVRSRDDGNIGFLRLQVCFPRSVLPGSS